MSTSPLVSVLMPAWNAAATIGAAIESALAQTWPRLEVIVVDDGSTDATADVVRQFDGPRVRLIRQPNAGQSAAQNTALAAAQGDVIQFLDADDLIGPDKVERQMARLAGSGTCIMSGEWARFYGEPNDAVFTPERVWRDLDPVTWLVESWTGGGGMMQAGIWLMPRPLLERSGGWDARLTLLNDFEFFTRVLLTAEAVRFCPGARLYYRSGNPDSLASRRSTPAWASALRAMQLGTGALLARSNTPRSRRACADVFQTLAFDAYLEHPDVAATAEASAAALGGSSIRLGGGLMFRALERTIGWKRAKRIRKSYRVRYARAS